MKTDLFDYELPRDMIALHPPRERDRGKLLVLGPGPDDLHHGEIRHLPDILAPGTLIMANDSRVVRARLRGRRPTGGAVDILLVRKLRANASTCLWTALAKSSKPLRPGDIVDLEGVSAEVRERGARGEVTLDIGTDEAGVYEHMEQKGEVPLPPYIKRDPVPEDKERYQTVFAREDGSVAAPTAGLHFTNSLIKELEKKRIEIAFVTLHVGPGTFRPVVSERIEDHRMDEEHYTLSKSVVQKIKRAKAEKRNVIAVGTTVVRTLEGCVAEHGKLKDGSGFTDLFITPGFELKVIDGLLTNFHLPRSTLLCLVSALAGRERVMAAYREAIRLRYRFYSYGDAMLILPKK